MPCAGKAVRFSYSGPADRQLRPPLARYALFAVAQAEEGAILVSKLPGIWRIVA
jgi:hypothetical protein